MKSVDKILTVPGRSISATELQHGTVAADKEQLNLNSLIAHAVRQLAPSAGSVVLRMDELPGISGIEAQLTQAFGLLLRFMLAHASLPGKVYCYVKGVPMGTTLLDDKSSYAAFGIEIHSSARESKAGQQKLLHQAAAHFRNNKIGFEYKAAHTGGMLFLLTIHGSAQTAGSDTGG